MQGPSGSSSFTFVVEHLDPEMGPWSTLEYACIATECAQTGAQFCLSSVPHETLLPQQLQGLAGLKVEHKSVEEIFAGPDAQRVCLLDPRADKELGPDDSRSFDVFLFGGILGDDPPRDRTAELRKKGFAGRRLGPVQMTTDTAVRVTRMVVQQQVALDQIEYIDHPEIIIDAHERTEMPFRYVKSPDGKPVMPEGMIELIKKDSDKALDDLLGDN